MSSRREDLGLRIIYLKDKMSIEEQHQELMYLFDEDDNGNNGNDYIDEDLLCKGYTCNAEYYLKKHTRKGKISDDGLIKISQAAVRDKNYYAEHEVEIIKIPDGKIIVHAYTCGC